MERRPLNKLSDVIFCVFALNTRLVPYLQMIYKKLVYIEHLRDTHIHTLIHRLLIIVWDRRRERPNSFEWEYGFSIKGGTNVCLSLFIAVLYIACEALFVWNIMQSQPSLKQQQQKTKTVSYSLRCIKFHLSHLLKRLWKIMHV